MIGDEDSCQADVKTKVRKAVAGDAEALSALLEDAAPSIRAQLDIAPKWRSMLDLDDVMQVTYMEAFLRIGQFAGDNVNSFRAWLRRIARNNLLAGIRHLSRQKRPPPDRQVNYATDESYVALCEIVGVTTTTPSRVATREESKVLVQNALKHLPVDYAAAIQLFDIEGKTGPEAAERMGRSRGAVFMLRARAHDRLRDLLGSGSQLLGRP